MHWTKRCYHFMEEREKSWNSERRKRSSFTLCNIFLFIQTEIISIDDVTFRFGNNRGIGRNLSMQLSHDGEQTVIARVHVYEQVLEGAAHRGQFRSVSPRSRSQRTWRSYVRTATWHGGQYTQCSSGPISGEPVKGISTNEHFSVCTSCTALTGTRGYRRPPLQ